VLGDTLAAGTNLACGLLNFFFARPTSTESSPFHAQVSLRVIT